MDKNPTMKKTYSTWYGPLVFMLAGAGSGIFAGLSIGIFFNSLGKISFGKLLLAISVILIFLFVSYVLQIAIHEAGHLVFGLLSGYSFSSYRIGSFIWKKEGGKIKLKRFSLAGTGGQCLMVPPEMKDGKFPVILYNLGGSIANMVFSLIFLLMFFVTRNIPVLKLLFSFLIIFGAYNALVNGVPMRSAGIDNDGYNAISLGENLSALKAFWIQLRVNEQVSTCKTREMPAEWFVPPADEDMKNSMVAGVGVFSCERLMDEKRFEEAERLISHYLSIDTAINGIHRSILICDIIYCILIDEKDESRRSNIDAWLDKDQKRFMKAMANYPAILRTEYALAMLYDKEPEKGKEIKNKITQIEKTFPYASDFESEKELIEIVDDIVERRREAAGEDLYGNK